MPDHPLRKILSRIIRVADPGEVAITYLHRGATNDQLTIKASSIANVRKGSFLLADQETQIPFHRILGIVNTKTGTVIWTKRIRAP